MIYVISTTILRLFLKVFFRLKVFGLDNLPRKGPYIAACNHTSYLDPPILGVSIPGRARFLARKIFFKKGLMGWWFRNTGCIPVSRDKGDIKAVKEAIKFLNRGEVIAMFPEGTRSPDGSLKRAKPGIGFLAFKANAPIVPAYIRGSKDAFSKHSKFFKLKPVSIYFGEKIIPADFKKAGNKKELYEKISEEVMKRILQLKQKYER